MKSYIPKQPKQTRERIEAKLEVQLITKLERYCQYLDSDRDYVLTQALELVFRKDKGFAEWLRTQNEATLPDAQSLSEPHRRGRKSQRALSDGSAQPVAGVSPERKATE